MQVFITNSFRLCEGANLYLGTSSSTFSVLAVKMEVQTSRNNFKPAA